MMTERRILPIGTVLYTKDALKKVMVIGRRMSTERNGKQFYFDYTVCLYPEGLLGAEVMFINNDDISDIIHLGLQDEDENQLSKRIIEWELRKTALKGTKELFKKE